MGSKEHHLLYISKTVIHAMEIASDSIALRYAFSLPVIEKLAVPIWGQPGIK